MLFGELTHLSGPRIEKMLARGFIRELEFTGKGGSSIVKVPEDVPRPQV